MHRPASRHLTPPEPPSPPFREPAVVQIHARAGRRGATGNADGTIRLWDAATGSQKSQPLAGPVGPVTSVAFSPDSTTLASASADHSVRLWDLATAAR